MVLFAQPALGQNESIDVRSLTCEEFLLLPVVSVAPSMLTGYGETLPPRQLCWILIVVPNPRHHVWLFVLLPAERRHVEVVIRVDEQIKTALVCRISMKNVIAVAKKDAQAG